MNEDQELRLVHFQHNGFIAQYKAVHLLSMPMNILDADANRRVFIGDPNHGDDEEKSISVWYTDPYTKILLDVNAGRVR